MRSGTRMTGIQTLAAGLLAITLALSTTPRAAHADLVLTSAQQTQLANMTGDVRKALEIGGKPQQVREYAALTVEASLITSFAGNMTATEADQRALKYLKPYIENPGSQRRQLGDADDRFIEDVKARARAVVEPRLGPPYADAVVFTTGLAVQNALEDPDMANAVLADGPANAASSATRDFTHLPPHSDPKSPFHADPVVVAGNGPAVTSSTASAAPAPVTGNGAPGPRPIDPNDPDAITATTDDGRFIQDRPDGSGGREVVEAPVSSPGSTQLVTNEEDLNAGQNNNSGNTKNRTGSDDGGKKDKDQQPNTSGGGSSTSSSSSGTTPHK